jgi:hypothetical protein
MMQWQPNQVVILTPKGTVIVARRLYERLEAWTPPDDQGLLRSFEWWMLLSEHVSGIQLVSLRPRQRA